MQRQATNRESGERKAESGAKRRTALTPSAFRFPLSAFPQGLTLIELLVTIVIMVTVLAGVIPLMSPNNDSRKIREASRQLTTLLAQAQAQAARDGRPAGVAFREFGTPGNLSGMSLEAFTIAVPQPFAGFSENSRVVVPQSQVATYGTAGSAPNGGTKFRANYNGWPVYELAFLLPPGAVTPDPFPPRMLRIGDTIEAAGKVFLICDDGDKTTMPNEIEDVNGIEYLRSDATATVSPKPGEAVHGIWLNGDFDATTGVNRRPLPANSPQVMYVIDRQPTNTSDAPLQFPRGIGIDLAASSATGPDGVPNLDNSGPTTIRLMFAANGSLQVLYDGDGFPRESIDNVFLLLGIFENGNSNSQEHLDYNFVDNPIPPGDKESLPQRRSRINWLNADSRWVTVNRAGRVVTSTNNTSFNPADSSYVDSLNGSTDRARSGEQKNRQLNGGLGNAPGARAFAQQMQTEGGR